MSLRVLVPKSSEMMSAPCLSASDTSLTRSDSNLPGRLTNVLSTRTSALGAMVRTTPATKVPWPA
jgi:hypothetical protein